MRGRKRIFSFIAVLSILFIVSAVFASGMVDVSKISLLGSPGTVEPLSPGTAVGVGPAWYIKDYLLQPIGSKFWVHVNVSDVANLFAWQINVTWNKAILNASRFITGNNVTYILYNTSSENHTASYQLGLGFGFGWAVNATNNAQGNAGAADSILDNRVGAAGVGTIGWLRLVSIQFLVVGYGKTNLVISTTGPANSLQTTLLDNTGAAITFTKTDGFFDNRIPGDITGPLGVPDRKVDGWDLTKMGKAYGSTPGKPNWDPEADITGPAGHADGAVDGWDLTAAGKNYGRTV